MTGSLTDAWTAFFERHTRSPCEMIQALMALLLVCWVPSPPYGQYLLVAVSSLMVLCLYTSPMARVALVAFAP